MQCPHCTMIVPMVADTCPYCGKLLALRQPQKSISIGAFGVSMLFDTLLMLAALVLPLAQQGRNETAFRLISGISNQANQWPNTWVMLSYGYLIVALLAGLCSVSCLITQNRGWALGALLCGLASLAMLASFGFGVLLAGSGYSPGLGFWLGLAGSFTLTTSSMLVNVLIRK